ncbi:hypothetical protein SAMN05444358_103322 [Ruegeria halocynthiae]|uniref:Uncharacterized protein n=1 Tax=Ruegeria halocynthiae TaxID=985054 RepID=A0A1H2ZPJ5_9RHOB|nr:DUF6653 family protein [Ruegeria halocynthiae]SDX19442.1 hypothetical protein SAMN05444358_103322 [Ruegeria halocynthiae]
MNIVRLSERLMGMKDEVWLRHTNPWSVWTRVLTLLPLLALAIWSRAWIGGWAWVAVGAVLVWVWDNPRAFRNLNPSTVGPRKVFSASVSGCDTEIRLPLITSASQIR